MDSQRFKFRLRAADTPYAIIAMEYISGNCRQSYLLPVYSTHHLRARQKRFTLGVFDRSSGLLISWPKKNEVFGSYFDENKPSVESEGGYQASRMGLPRKRDALITEIRM
jgi:hypothetical protein